MLTKTARQLKLRVIIMVALALGIALLMWFAGYPNLVEKYYSQGLYPVICMVLHPVFNFLPFSVGDVLYILLVGLLLYTLIKLIKHLIKKRFWQALLLLLKAVAGIEVAIIVFYLFWGMNYFRPPAAERLNLPDTAYTIDELKQVTTMLIDSANATRARLTPADRQMGNTAIYDKAIAAVKHLSASSVNFKTYSPGIKPALLTPLINYLGTSGYYNPFTTEGQLNYTMPVHVKPFVACHEMSHQTGFAPEDEANFAGFMAGIRSHDRLLRYSAYYEGMTEFMFALRGADSLVFKDYKKLISPAVMADLKAEREYWQYYQGRLEAISSLFYDNYLKVNNQPQGLMTYNRMIMLVLAWYRKGMPVKV